MKKYIWIACLFFMACGGTQEDAETKLSKLVNDKISGEQAYVTTAFVEQFWRIVGNTGFDSSIYKVVSDLEKAGFVNEDVATDSNRFTYRIERRDLDEPTWEPVNAEVSFSGEDEPLLAFSTNRNMIAVNSYSIKTTTPVVFADSLSAIDNIDVKGKLVFAETHPYNLYKKAIVEAGALGIITYNNPDYLNPEENVTSIQFRSIPKDSVRKPFGIVLSYEAKEQLKKRLADGPVSLDVMVNTKIYESKELTIVADIKGASYPEERLVFSAHVQEPGANDNATGVGVALEMATATAELIKSGDLEIDRTLTFLWGDEIVSTNRYVQENAGRAKNIKWGISLDMVGENTDITGGSFLIEKMPDPSAIWTRGKDNHTEWGAAEISLEDMQPHYLNDFVTNRFKKQGELAGWEVNTNPFEGGSDHVPFLKADIPGVLFWHFTDQFYHTDNDRLDKVSKETLKNVGTAALISAYTLLNADEEMAKKIISEVEVAALARLKDEKTEGDKAVQSGATVESQVEIINAWEDWYLKALASTEDLVQDKSQIVGEIESAQERVREAAAEYKQQLK
ncbi:M28 family peptidase [Fulvivirga sp. RKSG066]|uniref:M28 family metallopeptidase n=1 Tax=Fulvivirga aurantia TaxID=2529383 RepID=UPI0012BC7F26|nr:M28 family metallopeptidase [Fulvivirga aurantia]MTI20806.1 M28 family peptidase [Fulvivirga aurantia]